MKHRDVQLEISLWHNGKPVTQTGIIYTVTVVPDGEASMWLSSLGNGAHQYQVRFRWHAEIADSWVGAELMLIDGRGAVIGGPKPTLVYLGVSDIPMTTMFMCSWTDHVPTMAGIWVVAVRRADSMAILRQKLVAEGESDG